MTPTALQNKIEQWWQQYSRTLCDTADYDPWLPRERILDVLAGGVHWSASHTPTFDLPSGLATMHEVDPHGLTQERVRAVITRWWQEHRAALVESAVEAWSDARKRLFADVVARILRIESDAAALLPEEQEAALSVREVSIAPLGLSWMWHQAPPMLANALGYTGDRRLVSFCSTPTRQLRCSDGWKTPSRFGAWRAWQAFHQHPYVAHLQHHHPPYLLGLNESAPIWHCLILDRKLHLLQVQEILEGDLYVRAQHLYVYHQPVPPDHTRTTVSEEERLRKLITWLDNCSWPGRVTQTPSPVPALATNVVGRERQDTHAATTPLPPQPIVPGSTTTPPRSTTRTRKGKHGP